MAKPVNSESVHSVKENIQNLVENGSLPAGNSSNYPAGGVNKKSPSKVAPATPRKVKKPKLAATATEERSPVREDKCG